MRGSGGGRARARAGIVDIYVHVGYVVISMRGGSGGRERARVGIVIVLPPQHAFMWAKVVVSMRGGCGGRAMAMAGIVDARACGLCGGQCERQQWWKGKGGSR